MSLILEALKKVEKDKSRGLQKQNISSDILQSDRLRADCGADRFRTSLRTKRGRALLISCIVFSAAVLLAAAGAGINHLLSAKGNPSPAAPAVSKPERPAEAAPALVKPAQPEAAPPAAEVVRPPASREMPRHTEKDTEKVRLVKPPAAPAQSRRAPVETSVREEPPPVTIGGIIWSEESSRRRALVNGSTVKEGDTVDGVRVERIDSGRVLFSADGKTFAIPFR
jgi:hypothetical protein